MRVIVMIKGNGADEDKIAPTRKMLEAMNAYNEELVKAGIMVDGNGLRPTAEGVQVVFEGGSTSVVDGPFTESKEVIAGYWIWQVKSMEEAVEWVKRCPSDPDSGLREALEIRPIYETEDFGDELTPELREKEERLAEEIRAQHPNG